MEDFFYAGGLLALIYELGDKIDRNALTVSGQTWHQALANVQNYNQDVIRPLSNPVYHEGSLAVLKGNVAPDGAVIKPAACDPKFYQHRGPAIVADSYPAMKAIIEDPDYPMTPDHVLVLRNAGPQGGPGMPEWGMIPMPQALLKQGYRDMLRLSDARMSGTAFGACVLHIAPEAFVGGPLALVETGDIIAVDIPARRLNVELSDEVLVLQLHFMACFAMSNGGGDLMLASPSRPVPYEGGGEYGARQKARDQVAEFRSCHGLCHPGNHAASACRLGLVSFRLP